MKLTIHPYFIYRVPRFPADGNLDIHWSQLKACIAESSDTFYQIIKDCKPNEIANLPHAVQFTIWKYFNRARYRATPYGTFAAIGLDSFNDGTENSLTINSRQQLCQFVDWTDKDDIAITVKEVIEQDLLLISNGSFYSTKDAVRYISYFESGYELSDVANNETVVQILNHCLKPIRFSSLSKKLDQISDAGADLPSLINELMALQLIFCEKHPNIIGQDYFKRIGYIPDAGTPRYIIAKRKLISGSLNARMFRELPEMVSQLRRLLPVSRSKSLEQFVGDFLRKFGSEEIPLMTALDPEGGVGYGTLEHLANSNGLIEKLSNNRHSTDEGKVEALRNIVLNPMIEAENRAIKIIQIEKLGLDSEEGDLHPLPNSLGVLASVTDEGILIDSIGGCTANALLGRFSLAGTEFKNFCQAIARTEQEANPEILFFDVAYTAEKDVDNVNRRDNIYDHEVSILNYTTKAQPISLNDLTILVQGSDIILYSKTLRRRLIPRIASSYNYGRSDLSVFRFLSDLQLQGIQYDLNLNAESLLPGAKFLPRLQFKKFILSPAKWRITFADLITHTKQVNVKEYLTNLGIGRYFKTGFADQTLLFDKELEQDLEHFVGYLKKHLSLYAEEAFMPSKALIKDEKGKHYQNQLIITLTHGNEIYKGFEVKRTDIAVKTPKVIPPGNGWLYFEIYCHEFRSDQILTEQIGHYLKDHHAVIEKWFFIRYNENGNHLRIRILLKDAYNSQQLINGMSKLLNDDLDSGVVSDLLLRTYRRETERYGGDFIEYVENHFSHDSTFAINMIAGMFSDYDKYKLCAELITSIQSDGSFSDEDLANLLGKISDAFSKEHKLTPKDFKELNIAFKAFRDHKIPELTNSVRQTMTAFHRSFSRTIKLASPDKRNQLFADLLHMHVNRLFASKQRTQEMILYYFLNKEMKIKAKSHPDFHGYLPASSGQQSV